MKEEHNREIRDLLKEFTPQPTARYQQRMQKEAAWLQQENRLPRKFWPNHRWQQVLSAAAIVLFVGFVVVLAFPSLRVAAQGLTRYFTRSESNTVEHTFIVQATPAQRTPNPVNFALADYPLSMEEVRQELGVDVKVPQLAPDDYRFLGGNVRENVTNIRYESTDRMIPIDSFEIIAYVQDDNPAHGWFVTEIGKDAEVETVAIGDLTGEYVEGYWHDTTPWPMDAEPGTEVTITSEWHSDWRAVLRWQDGDIDYILRPLSAMNKSNLIAIARCMYIPFDIAQPEYKLNGLRRFFARKDIECNLDTQLITQTFWTRGALLVVRQIPLSGENPGVVREESSTDVTINGQTAKFIAGQWIGPIPDYPLLADVDTATTGVRWQVDDMQFELWSVGHSRRAGDIDAETLIAIAESIR